MDYRNDGRPRGSPIDTKIEVFARRWQAVERLLLQAVRNSRRYLSRVDSTTADCRVENGRRWNSTNGSTCKAKVVKLFRAPQGPDSGFLFYTSAGKRHAFFDTSPTAHALDEPCYIVEPHRQRQLAANGLPLFTLLCQR